MDHSSLALSLCLCFTDAVIHLKADLDVQLLARLRAPKHTDNMDVLRELRPRCFALNPFYLLLFFLLSCANCLGSRTEVKMRAEAFFKTPHLVSDSCANSAADKGHQMIVRCHSGVRC